MDANALERYPLYIVGSTQSTTPYLQWAVLWVGFSTVCTLWYAVVSPIRQIVWYISLHSLLLPFDRWEKLHLSLKNTLLQVVNDRAPPVDKRLCAMSVVWTYTFDLAMISASAVVPSILRETADRHCSFCAQSSLVLSSFLYNEALRHFALPKVLHAAALFVL